MYYYLLLLNDWKNDHTSHFDWGTTGRCINLILFIFNFFACFSSEKEADKKSTYVLSLFPQIV